LIVTAEIISECLERHGNKNKRDRVKFALGCYNGDPVKYPPRVFAAMGELIAEGMEEAS
jgi:hypothetical protein